MKNTNLNNKPPHSTKPWYRHGFVWLVIAIPVLAVIISFTLIAIAATHKDSVVKDNWYMDGKALRQDLSLDFRAYQQGMQAKISIPDDHKIELVLSSTSPQFPFPKQLSMSLFHATLPEKDQTVILTQGVEPGHYQGVLKQHVLPGKYHLELLYPDHWRLQKKVQYPLVNNEVDLAPLPSMKFATPEEAEPIQTTRTAH